MFARIEDGIIAETRPQLPRQVQFPDGRKTGNFDLFDPSVQAQAGWYPLVDQIPVHDSRIERAVVDSFAIIEGQCVRTWSIEPSPLADLQAQQIAEVQALWSAKLADSLFQFEGAAFRFSETLAANAAQLQTALSLPGAEFPAGFSWTRADGAEMPMDHATFLAFAGAITTHKLGLAMIAKSKIAAIRNLSDPLAVATFDTAGGW